MVETCYLGVRHPLLHAVCDFLAARIPAKQQSQELVWDLSDLILVLPTARARRRLGDVLQQYADSHRWQLKRPVLATVGELPGRLIRSKLPLATELEQTLAWTAALTERTDDDLKSLVIQPPPREPQTPWLELSGTLVQLNESLHSSELQLSDVLDLTLSPAEQARWRLLNEIHARYLSLLHQAGRQDPQVARLAAQRLGSQAPGSTDLGDVSFKLSAQQQLVLIGTSDLNRSLIALLKSLPAACRVIALVAADPEDRDHFDSFGSVITQRWLDRHVPLQLAQLLPGQDLPDQARLAAELVVQCRDAACLPDGDLAATSDDHAWTAAAVPLGAVTVGVTDESQVAPAEFELRSLGVASCRELGWSIGQTSIGRLLNLLADYLTAEDWRSFAALIRHADLALWIDSQLPQQDWLTAVDQLRSDHFPVGTIDQLPPAAATKHALAVQLRTLVDQSLSELHASRRPLSQWAQRLADWIEWLHSHLGTADTALSHLQHSGWNAARDRSRRAREDTIAYLRNIKELQRQLDSSVDGSTAIEMLLSRLRLLRIVDDRQDCPVTIVGWLDLALDDAPEMVILSLNHPFVPELAGADPFIPMSLRTRIQSSENERRYARDLHALEVILRTRRAGAVKIIVGSSSADGSPTPPSRLLSSGSAEQVASRLVQLYQPRVHTRLTSQQDLWSQPRSQSQLPIPQLDTTVTVPRLSVTAFKDYLTCPYRFYLRHVLRIRPLDDASGELMANQFGDLIHHVLEDFGNGQFRDATSARTIEKELHQLLDQQAAEQYGPATTAAVRLQIEQARRRLSHVAEAQAERRNQGWRIHQVEAPLSHNDSAGIMVDNQWMPIRGRIDRIDHHEDQGRWAIIDYKTHGHTPRKKHLKVVSQAPQWIDLQLPLYRLLVPFVLQQDIDVSQVSLSYFNVGDNREQTGVNDADFSPEEFAVAEATIESCVRRIRQGDFAPAKAVEFDDYAMILQTGVVANLFQRLNPAGPEDET